MESPGSEGVGFVETQVVELALPPGGFALDGGRTLARVQVAYEMYGALSPERDNVIFICHALSGDAHAAGRHAGRPADTAWWDEMIGPGRGIDTDHYCVVCANILGGCKGTTGPGSIDPATGRPYGAAFPPITVGDIVGVHRLLLLQLGIERLAAVVGGSFGGMQALEWARRFPAMVSRCICIASARSLSAQALAFDIVGRQAIMSDPDWQGGDYYGTGREPARGLSQARKIGHITYLSPGMMTHKFGRERRESLPAGGGADDAAGRVFCSDFQVESYLDHQGRKFVDRFDANSYLHITRAMDDYELGEQDGGLDAALRAIEGRVLIVALSSDWLFPPEQSVELSNALLRAGRRVSYCLLHAPHGHDAFLVAIEHLSEAIRAFLPWVGRRPSARRPDAAGSDEARRARRQDEREREFETIVSMVPEGARVLDLGCGDGRLLSLLAERRGIVGLGVDLDIHNVIRVLDRGHDVLQSDIDGGLSAVPDGAYDVAILGETLQEVRKPRLVLREMLRVARTGIVTFPNFGQVRHRLHLWLRGRMPKGGALPYEWYDTPNIHLFTLRDFRDLCRRDGLAVLDSVCLCDGRFCRAMVRAGFCNAGAERVIVKIARTGGGEPAGGCAGRPGRCGGGCRAGRSEDGGRT